MGLGRAIRISSLSLIAVGIACSASGTDLGTNAAGGGGGAAGVGGGSVGGTGGATGTGGDPGTGGSFAVGGGGGAAGQQPTVYPDPTTCAQAADAHSYLGCDFWPTVVDNSVQPTFDFAAVVANTQDTDATITVTRGTKVLGSATVGAKGLLKVYLPWVEELKSLSWLPGQPDNGCPTFTKTNTVRAPDGAYHLTSTLPVAVYQFNAIEYAGKGGPTGKDWSTCKTCAGLTDCYSYSNDASLLLPATAMTPNYRIAGVSPWKPPDSDPNMPSTFFWPPYFAITGTEDGTMVTVQMSKTGAIAPGGGVPALGPGGKTTFPIAKGEVVMIVGATMQTDFSGSLVKATAPVQVISGIGCTQMPDGTPACDHIEESVLPAETLGNHYFVTQPTDSKGKTSGHVVRLYGNVDGTKLTYPGAKPGGAPATIDAGDMIELGVVTQDFEIVGDHELLVGSFQIGEGSESAGRLGDPSMSFITTVQQFRVKYIFLTPDDYDVSFVDVTQPMDATVTIDGAPTGVTPTAISSGYGVARVKLGPGNGGAHTLESTGPVGIQVMGYGAYTSYQYPGGLNLGMIAPPPPLLLAPGRRYRPGKQ